MFDVGFSEMVLIGIVALLVLGPERLPKVARTAGMWAGRARRFLSNVKADIDRELKAEELKQIMQKQAQSTGIHELVEQTRGTVGEIRQATSEAVASAQSVPGAVTSAVNAEVAGKPATPPAASTPAAAPAQTNDK